MVWSIEGVGLETPSFYPVEFSHGLNLPSVGFLFDSSCRLVFHQKQIFVPDVKYKTSHTFLVCINSVTK